MIKISRRLLISASKESVRLYLKDLRNLADYEQKIGQVEIKSQDDEKGLFEASGRFLAFPWRAAFQVEFTADGGYRSFMLHGPLSRMVFIYHLRAVSGGTIVTHEEEYLFPLPLRPFMPLFTGWLNTSIDLELRSIKEGAERLHRQIKLREIESSL